MAVVPSDPTHPHYGATLTRWPPDRVAAALSEKIVKNQIVVGRRRDSSPTPMDPIPVYIGRFAAPHSAARLWQCLPSSAAKLCGKMSGLSNLVPRAGVLLIATIPVDPLFHGGKRSAIALSASSTDKAR